MAWWNSAKTTAFWLITAAGLALLTTSSEAQPTLWFAPNPGGSLQFNGDADSFSFNNGTNGWQWNVAVEIGGASAVGLNASVKNGPFSYGPITNSGSGGFQLQYATALGPPGKFVLSDGAGSDLTGTVNWIDVATYGSGVGLLNAAIDINLSNFQYSGSNPDLQYLVANQQGSMDVSFQFATAETLTELSTGPGPYLTTSYSESIPIPEPSTLALAGLGALALLHLRRRN